MGKISKHKAEAKALYDALGHDERCHHGAALVLVVALRQYLEELGAIERAIDEDQALNAYVLARKTARAGT